MFALLPSIREIMWSERRREQGSERERERCGLLHSDSISPSSSRYTHQVIHVKVKYPHTHIASVSIPILSSFSLFDSWRDHIQHPHPSSPPPPLLLVTFTDCLLFPWREVHSLSLYLLLSTGLLSRLLIIKMYVHSLSPTFYPVKTTPFVFVLFFSSSCSRVLELTFSFCSGNFLSRHQ